MRLSHTPGVAVPTPFTPIIPTPLALQSPRSPCSHGSRLPSTPLAGCPDLVPSVTPFRNPALPPRVASLRPPLQLPLLVPWDSPLVAFPRHYLPPGLELAEGARDMD